MTRTFAECHLEWSDGREYWSEDPAAIARAIFYRRRVRGGRGLPYAVTCWEEGPGDHNRVLWEMEWTAMDQRPTSDDVAGMISQQVPPLFIYQLFPNADTLAQLREWTDDPHLPEPALRGNRKVQHSKKKVCNTCTIK